MEQNSVTVEQTVHAPVAKVWQALINQEEMQHWYFDFPEFKPVVGFEFQFYGSGQGGEKFLHLCKIIEIIPKEKLEYSWRYDGIEGISFVTIELSTSGINTSIRLNHVGLATFPKNNPNFSEESFQQGWLQIIGNSLKNYIENKERM
jgi:uncharacterized protein YndB with AHSA1/START domain